MKEMIGFCILVTVLVALVEPDRLGRIVATVQVAYEQTLTEKRGTP